jgi:hypothetical protein
MSNQQKPTQAQIKAILAEREARNNAVDSRLALAYWRLIKK